MTARELITYAYYLSNMVSRGLQTVTGMQIADGLVLLNDILAEKAADGSQIVYYQRYDFPGVIGEEEYFIENLVEISSLTVNLENVRFSMQPMTRRLYFGDPRVNEIQSIPYTYYTERAIEDGAPGMKIFVYFEPSQTSYIFELVGKYSIQEVGLDTNLNNFLENFYLSYLKYKLASRICEFNGQLLEPNKMATLVTLERQVTEVNAIDLSLDIDNAFRADGGLTYADVNIGKLWRP